MQFDLNTRHLRAICAIADAGSVTAAAASLGVTQPALSATLRQAETIVETPLVERSGRRVKLTAAGLTLLPDARRILREVGRATAQMRDLAHGRTGRLTIAAIPSAAYAVVAPAMSRFAVSHPGIAISIRDALNDKVIEAVRTGEAELGFGVPRQDSAGLTLQTILNDRFIAAIPSDHPLATRDRLRWSDLHGEQIVNVARGSNTRATVAGQLGVEEETASRIDCAIVPTAVGLVAQGLGVSVLSELSCRPFRGMAGVSFRELAEPAISRPLCLIMDATRLTTPAAAAFRAHLRGFSAAL